MSQVINNLKALLNKPEIHVVFPASDTISYDVVGSDSLMLSFDDAEKVLRHERVENNLKLVHRTDIVRNKVLIKFNNSLLDFKGISRSSKFDCTKIEQYLMKSVTICSLIVRFLVNEKILISKKVTIIESATCREVQGRSIDLSAICVVFLNENAREMTLTRNRES